MQPPDLLEIAVRNGNLEELKKLSYTDCPSRGSPRFTALMAKALYLRNDDIARELLSDGAVSVYGHEIRLNDGT